MARPMLTAVHAWVVNGETLVTINDLDATGYPRTDLDTSKGVTNWHTLPDFDIPDPDKPVGVMGERPILGTSRGKTLVYNLIARTDNSGGVESLDAHMDALRGAFANRTRTGQIVLVPWADGGQVWATYARVIDFTGDEFISRPPGASPSPWQRDVSVGFRLLDGRWYWWNEADAESPGDPLVFTDGDDAVEVTNSGTAPTDPIIDIEDVDDGDDIHIGRDATSEYPEQSLWFRGVPLGTLTVDFSTRTASVGGVDVTDTLDEAESDWWDDGVPGIPPGNFNVWRGPGAGGALTCSFFSASW